jgi:site-specific DNA-methyltransferase (cytosine-N4-specific)
MPNKTLRRFTYGAQFEHSKTPLLDLLNLCRESEHNLATIKEQIRVRYFPGHGNADNSNKMAMNCWLSLKAYGLVQQTTNENGVKEYATTPLANELIELANGEGEVAMFRRFAVHILSNLYGLILLKMIENIRARGEQLSLEYIGDELNEIGLKIPTNSTYISTMTGWLSKAGVVTENGYSVNWDVVYELLKTDAELIDKLHELTLEQRFFMLSMLSLAITDFVPSNKIAKHTRSVYSVRLTTKNLVKDILEPLEAAELIEIRKTTTGRGAKPHDIKIAEKGKNDLLLPMLENLSELTEMTSADLNRPFEDIVKDLNHADKHVRGIALELFAVWIIRLLGLRFSKWRLRSFQATGGAEVDVMAASDKIVYSRWQMQCKNTKSKVTVDTVAKEVGLNFLTQADVIALITTGGFTGDAINYANQVTDNSRYYVILLDGEDIKRIVADRTKIVDILNVKARRVFAKKELGLTDFIDEQEEIDEQEFEEAIADEVEPLLRQAIQDSEESPE